MRWSGSRRVGLIISVLMGLILPGQAPVTAEQLPIRTYTTADGLARDGVYKIMRDSRGLLWFCTGEGLSRFDGYQFKNYTPADGLPHWVVRDIIETRDGGYYLATNDGICRFNPTGLLARAADSAARPAFTVYRPESEKARRCLVLYEDSDGTIWCGTEAGLYRLETAGDDRALRYVEVRGVGQLLDTIINTIVARPCRVVMGGGGERAIPPST